MRGGRGFPGWVLVLWIVYAALTAYFAAGVDEVRVCRDKCEGGEAHVVRGECECLLVAD